MRVLYVCRLFTGLEHSLHTRQWEPTGVPTIYRMMETLDRQANVSFVITRKDVGLGSFSTWNKREDQLLQIAGLNHSIWVLAGEERFPLWLGRRIRSALREVRQFVLICLEIWRFRPDVIYADHSNSLAAGVLARVVNIPVVYRLMGVYPAMRRALTDARLSQRILRWCYRAPYSLVVCTQDGSGVENWLGRALRPGVRLEVLLNGVTVGAQPEMVDKRIGAIPSDKVRILYIGKLEKYKGCYEFAEAMLRVRHMRPGVVHGIIIGIGNERESLVKRIAQAGAASDFTFIDRLPHTQISAAHRQADVYVSLNWVGNLSNANLEAMALGECIVFPESDPEMGIDVVTDRLLGNAGIPRISRKDPVNALVEILIHLCDHPGDRTKIGRAVGSMVSKCLQTWEQRIRYEYSLIEALAGKTKCCPAGGASGR